MKLAVIDIGSNAIRFQVSSITDYQGEYVFKKIEYVRFPLRLGQTQNNQQRHPTAICGDQTASSGGPRPRGARHLDAGRRQRASRCRTRRIAWRQPHEQ